MEYSEKYGVDVDEAVRLALDELGLREDQVMVTVLEEPAKGFLGMGSKYAKVRVEKIEDADTGGEDLTQAEALAQAEKARSQTKANHDFRKKKMVDDGNSIEPREERTENGARSDRGDRGERDRDRRSGQGRDGKSGGGRGRDRDRGGKNRSGGRDIELNIDFSAIERINESIENLVPDPENEAAKFLAEVTLKMGLNVKIEGFCNDDCNYIEITGEDSRLVIGKRGQTLDALQYLTNLVSNKGAEEYKRVIIDVEGYRSRREKTLEQLAIKLAKKVLSTGRPARLEPMNPYERKVIHATLQQVEGIATKSEGEEPYRRVIIERK